jgi:hypothetical protein
MMVNEPDKHRSDIRGLEKAKKIGVKLSGGCPQMQVCNIDALRRICEKGRTPDRGSVKLSHLYK